jgi:hypothetical protein
MLLNVEVVLFRGLLYFHVSLWCCMMSVSTLKIITALLVCLRIAMFEGVGALNTEPPAKGCFTRQWLWPTPDRASIHLTNRIALIPLSARQVVCQVSSQTKLPHFTLSSHPIQTSTYLQAPVLRACTDVPFPCLCRVVPVYFRVSPLAKPSLFRGSGRGEA